MITHFRGSIDDYKYIKGKGNKCKESNIDHTGRSEEEEGR
jgi:hypothetical protein